MDSLNQTSKSLAIQRRFFLKQGIGFGLGVLAFNVKAQDRMAYMLKPGEPLSSYGKPSQFEASTIRAISANAVIPGNGISWTPLHKLSGTITPSGLHFERHHNGVPKIDPSQHRLLIHGLVDKPLIFKLDQLLRYPMESRICFVECGGNSNALWHEEPMQAPAGNMHGLVSCSEWTGIPLSILLNEAQIKPQGRWLIAEGADAALMNISIPLEKAMEDAILAIYQNGERLRPENGYPMRLILPGFEAVTQVKWVHRLQISDQPVMARNETAKYTELQKDGKSRQFTFVMEAKSLITRPSYGQSLAATGIHQIEGLAWSGRGKILRVEVSWDGGKNWMNAKLQEPILSKSFTRFTLPWHWDGTPAILKSRAVDETGYVQPERKNLLEQRGRNGYFHYNGIVSWAVDADGSIHHVYS